MATATPHAHFDHSTVRYRSYADLAADFAPYLSHGALFVDGAELPPPLEEFPLALVLPGGKQLALHGRVVAHPGAGALIQTDLDGAALAELRALALAAPLAGTLPAVARASAPSVRAPHLLPRGSFVGLDDLDELRREPLRRDRPPTDGTTPRTLLALLRRLAAERQDGLLLLDGEDHLELPLRLGRVLLGERQRESFARAVRWRQGRYDFRRGQPPLPSGRHDALDGLAVEGLLLRRWLREAGLAELAAALPLGQAPRLLEPARDLLDRLQLTAAEIRFAGRRLDGATRLGELCHGGGLSDLGALRLVAYLDLLGLLGWAEGRAMERPHEEPLAELLAARRQGDLFHALGLHYSDGPRRLAAAKAELLRAVGPRSAAMREQPEIAAALRDLAERAAHLLGDRSQRDHYRREVLHLDPAALGAIKHEQGKWAIARGDLDEALLLLDDAADLDPTPIHIEALARLRGALDH